MLLKVLREPFIIFLALGASIFFVFELRGEANNTAPPPPEQSQILLTQGIKEHLERQFQQTWDRKPDQEELDKLMNEFVKEEILVREATLLGLDQNDQMIRARLQQKMENLALNSAEALDPTEDELKQFYEGNLTQYIQGANLSFQQLYLGRAPTTIEINTALSKLNSNASNKSVGQPSKLPAQLKFAQKRAIDGIFGPLFFPELIKAPVNQWTGPVRSGLGLHLVKVNDRTLSPPPPLAAIKDQLVEQWRQEKANEIMRTSFDRIKLKYEIVDLTGTAQ